MHLLIMLILIRIIRLRKYFSFYYISYEFTGENYMSGKNDKEKNNYYFLLFTGMGLVFGMIFDQLTIGLCLGVAIGLALDNKKKK